MYVTLGASPAVAITATTAGTAGQVAQAAEPLFAAGSTGSAILAPIPIVGGIIAGALALSAFFLKGANPQEGQDVANMYNGALQINQLLNEVEGPGTYDTSCVVDPKGRCSSGKSPISNSKYPGSYGPLGNPAVDIDQAIAQYQQILQATLQSQVLPQSRNNAFFTTPYGLNDLLKIKAARAKAGVPAAGWNPATTTPGSSGGIGTLLLIGGGIAAAMAFA